MTDIKWIYKVEGITDELTNKVQAVINELDMPIKEVSIEVSNYKSPIVLSPGKVANKVFILQLYTGDIDREIIGFFPHKDSNDIEPIIYKEDLEEALINLWLRTIEEDNHDMNEVLVTIKRLGDKIKWIPLEEGRQVYPLVIRGEYSYFYSELYPRTNKEYAAPITTGKRWKVLYSSPHIISTPEPITLISKRLRD